MHTDLSPHLHSDKCNELIRLLQECHQNHPLKKFIGACNTQDKQMTLCLKEERLARRKRNYEKSLETKERLRKAFKEEQTEQQH